MTPSLWFLLPFIGCSIWERPLVAPATSLDHAQVLLREDGWALRQETSSVNATTGCLSAAKGHLEGKVCLHDCAGRDLYDIAGEPGYLYIVGKVMSPPAVESCGHYWTFHGSDSLMLVVAGPWLIQTREKWDGQGGTAPD